MLSLKKCLLAVAVLIIVSIHQASTTIPLSSWFTNFKLPLANKIRFEGEPNYDVEQNDLVDFFYKNEFNDHEFNPEDGWSTATDYMIKSTNAKYKFSVSGYALYGLHFYDSEKEKLLASGPNVNQTKCEQHINYMVEQSKGDNTHLSKGSNINLMRIIDSFGRPDVSTLESYNGWLGNHLQCVTSKLLIPTHNIDAVTNFVLNDEASSNFEKISMQYCYAYFRYPGWLNSTFYRRNLVMKSALCLPETCDSFSGDIFSKQLVELAESNYGERQLGFYYSGLYCLPHPESKLMDANNDIVYRSFKITMYIWIATIVVCSIYHFRIILRNYLQLKGEKKSQLQSQFINLIKFEDGRAEQEEMDLRQHLYDLRKEYYNMRIKQTVEIAEIRKQMKKEEKLPTIVSIFSLMANWRKLFGDEENDHARIDVVDRLKATAMVIIVCGHCALVGGITTHTVVEMKSTFDKIVMGDYLVFLPVLLVCCFLVINGFLTALSKSNHKNWSLFISRSYLRLMPILLVAVWFTKAYGRYAGHGPMWDYATSNSSALKNCRDEPWFMSVFLLNNLRELTAQCVVPSWYLATYFQLQLLAPPLIMVMRWNHKIGYLLCLMIIVVATIMSSMILTWSNVSKMIYMFMTPLNITLMDDIYGFYSLPVTRCTPYIIGLVAGHITRRYKDGLFTIDYKFGLWERIKGLPSNDGSLYKIVTGLVSFLKSHSMITIFLISLPLFGSLPNYLVGSVLKLEGSWSNPIERFLMATFQNISLNSLSLPIALFLSLSYVGYEKWYYMPFISFPFYRAISRASLSILVFHLFIAFRFNLGSETRMDSSSSRMLLMMVITSAVVSIIACMILCLLIELPLANMISTITNIKIREKFNFRGNGKETETENNLNNIHPVSE